MYVGLQRPVASHMLIPARHRGPHWGWSSARTAYTCSNNLPLINRTALEVKL